MKVPVPVVDIFSGPGGLAEGFANLRDCNGRLLFQVALSVEMDPTAYRTLRLRAFLRKFQTSFPQVYYDFLNGSLLDEPDWNSLYPNEWGAASCETQCLKLGTTFANFVVQKNIQEIVEKHGNRTVLIGGPPCQSYSVAGRARNAGNSGYNPDKDERQSLYQEYAAVLGQLQPSIAVLENVKGMLSARHNAKLIFPEVMDSLMHAGGANRYRLFALSSTQAGRSWGEGVDPKDFLVRAEMHGVPQTRHRVFIICVRRDLAEKLTATQLPILHPGNTTVTVRDVIGHLPALRSRLSCEDDAKSWQRVVVEAHKTVRRHQPSMPAQQKLKFAEELDRALNFTVCTAPPFRDAEGGTVFPNTCPADLRDWIYDPRLSRLPNNETRGHIDEDMTRYLFAAAFASTFGRSPRAADFPVALAPKHASWNTGRFGDRFRVQLHDRPSTTITSHISKDGHYFIHPDPAQCRSLTVREAARLQTFPDNYFFHGGRTQQYVQVGNAVPPYLSQQIAIQIWKTLQHHE